MAQQEEKQRNPIRLILALAVIAFGVLLLVNGVSRVRDDRQRLFAPNGFLQVEVVDTPGARQQGLSGREGLAPDEGMLFVFDQPSDGNCFWMKDMQFAIDMVWLDSEKRVLNVAPDVSPDTYPASFCPKGAATYGLEVSANRAAALDISPGEQLRF